MLYLHLAASGASLPFVTITGEDPETTAVVAANVAAAAAAACSWATCSSPRWR